MWSISESVQNKEIIKAYFEWQLPVRDRRSAEIDRSSSFSKYFKLYCKHSSLNGWKYLAEPGRPWFERLLWIVIYVITLYVMGIIVLNIYRQYEESDVVVTVDSDHYPSNLIEFPGVALCTINRISYKSAVELATKINNANVSRLIFEEILESIRYLGNLYESVFETHGKYQKELDDLLRAYHKGDYDVTEIMRNLTPPCSEVLSNCFFDGIQHNCSDIFEFRKTQDGFCCTFNYARGSDDFMVAPRKSSYRTTSPGVVNALTMVMKPYLDDYFYPILPATGWKVTIFKPDDYPDSASGGVSDVLISPLTRMYLGLDAVTLDNSDDIYRIPLSKRRCVFHNELHKLLASYTYSDCILKCKLEDIWQTCGCTPFFLPKRNDEKDGRFFSLFFQPLYQMHAVGLFPSKEIFHVPQLERFVNVKGSERICNTADTDCLREHKSKWSSVLPSGIRLDEKEKAWFSKNANLSSYLICAECYPSCDDVQYFLYKWTTELQPGIYVTEPLHGVTIVDHSVLQVYFIKQGTVRLRQDVAYYWYELLSNIGGICGVFIGFSLISLVEFIYFSFLPFFPSVRELTTGTTKKLGKKRSATYGTLYWNELLPRRERKIRVRQRGKKFVME